MLRKLSVSNYRSIGDSISVRFGRLTALVGANGSGKSNVVDAIRFLADSMQMGLSGAITHRHGIRAVRRWSAGRPFNVSISIELGLPNGSGRYGFELRGDSAEEYSIKSEVAEIVDGEDRVGFRVEDGAWKEGPSGLQPKIDKQSLALPVIAGDVRFKSLAQALEGMSIYTIFPDTLRSPQKYSPAKPMDRHGSNWASILRDQPRKTWKPELVQALSKLTGDIEDIKVSLVASYLAVQFRHESDTKTKKWFDAAQESDGTLRFAGIVTALLQEPPVPIIGIEEPELTVHPGAIPLLFDYLVQASKRSQVLITTHSPELLDLLDADDVRIVERRRGFTTVDAMASEQREIVRSGLHTLGEIFRTEGLQQDLSMLVAENE